jgi:hypothetical protein
MRKTLVMLFAGLAVVVMVGFASQAAAASQAKATTTTQAPAQHGHQFSGTVGAFDEAAKLLKVKDSKGKEHEFNLTTATTMSGTAKVGEHVVVRYLIKEGKNVATAISFGAPPAAKTTTPPAAPATK